MLLGRRVLMGFVGALLFACASPTLPLPPPEAPTATAGSQPGMVHLTGANAEPNAEIIIRNMNTALPTDHQLSGSIVNGDGTWDADVYGQNGDVLNITQQVGTTISQPLVFTLKL